MIVEYIEEVGGIYFRTVVLPKAGIRIPQHVHDHDHPTFCGAGRALPVVDGVPQEELLAGRAFLVKAGQKHEFVALEDGTRLTCVHDVSSAESIKKRGL